MQIKKSQQVETALTHITPDRAESLLQSIHEKNYFKYSRDTSIRSPKERSIEIKDNEIVPSEEETQLINCHQPAQNGNFDGKKMDKNISL